MSVGRRDDQAYVTVSDNGPGIPESDRARVLERFLRLNASRSVPGTGLGLSLVAATAELHQANLVLEDNAPGLKVTILFQSIARSSAVLTKGGLGREAFP